MVKIVAGMLFTAAIVIGFETREAVGVPVVVDEISSNNSNFFADVNHPIPNSRVGGKDSHPAMAADSKGNLYAAFEHTRSTGDRDIYIAYFNKSPSSRKWYPSNVAGLISDVRDNRQPSITFDPFDNMYLVAKGPCPADIPDPDVFWFLKRTPAGDSIYYIENTNWYMDCSYPVVAANEVGIWIAMQIDTAGQSDIRVLFSESGTTTFNIIPITAPPVNEQHPSIAAGGTFAVLAFEYESGTDDWDIFVTRAMTNDFVEPKLITGTTDNETDPYVAASGNHFYIGYTKGKDVWLAYSSNGGESFDNIAVAATAAAERHPAVACNGSKVYVAYLKDSTQVLHKKSTNGGVTWSAAERVSDDRAVVVDTVRATGAVYHSKDSTHVCWVDNRNATSTGWDIYHAMVGEVGGSGVTEDERIKSDHLLVRCQPSPFTKTTTINYYISQVGWVRLQIYDVVGNLVRTLDSGNREPGTHRRQWNGSDDAGDLLSAGVYFIRLTTQNGTQTERIILMR